MRYYAGLCGIMRYLCAAFPMEKDLEKIQRVQNPPIFGANFGQSLKAESCELTTSLPSVCRARKENTDFWGITCQGTTRKKKRPTLEKIQQ
jgi:hypothetical protein